MAQFTSLEEGPAQEGISKPGASTSGLKFPISKGHDDPIELICLGSNRQNFLECSRSQHFKPPKRKRFPSPFFSLPSDSLSDWRRGSGVQWGIVTQAGHKLALLPANEVSRPGGLASSAWWLETDVDFYPASWDDVLTGDQYMMEAS